MKIDRSRVLTHTRRDLMKIENDPELRAFVDDVIRHLTFDEAVAACRQKFGQSRAPGRSTIHRYWTRIKNTLPQCDIKRRV